MKNRKGARRASWNPLTGCTKISSGCKNCYAETMAKRFQKNGVKGYENGFLLTLHNARLSLPLRTQPSTEFFVNSMSDLFHKDVPVSFLDKVFDIIQCAKWHQFQILTKRADIMAEYFKIRPVPENVWLGVTVENKAEGIPRIDILRSISDVQVRFLSVEPLLEDLGDVDFSGIAWVGVGGEAAVNARPMKKEWVLNIKECCERDNAIFYFKQWGNWGEDMVKRSKYENGILLNNQRYRCMPEIKQAPQQLSLWGEMTA